MYYFLLISIILLHYYFLLLEMFFWNTSYGIKVFGLKNKNFANETKVLAANQGLYNGFIATGLLYSIIENSICFQFFFLLCIISAGIYGAISTSKIKLFYIQALPAIIGIVVYFLNIN